MQNTIGAAAPALPADPVIEWLERIRDYVVATPESKELAQRAIDRLTRADEPTIGDVIEQLRHEMGCWRARRGSVVADRPGATQFPAAGPDDLRYYGGHLVAESMSAKAAIAVARLPQLLDVASATPEGREVLADIARDLTDPRPTQRVVDRLDGSLRIHRLADDFEVSDFDGVAHLLRALAATVMDRTTPALAQRLYDWMERERERAR
ncbi:MAG TPA: hypothetical protein VM364_00740 [Vicinamibacterales bacterium]|nr:hypothetical protein [Vicinamibacterales bacterium]